MAIMLVQDDSMECDECVPQYQHREFAELSPGDHYLYCADCDFARCGACCGKALGSLAFPRPLGQATRAWQREHLELALSATEAGGAQAGLLTEQRR